MEEGEFDERKEEREGKKGAKEKYLVALREIFFPASLAAPLSRLPSVEYLGPHTRIEADGDESLARYGSWLAATWKSLNGLYPAAYSRAVRLRVRIEDRRDSGVKLRRS